VTRIIAGTAGSLVLAVPDAGTRPTSDRVRESLFGALEAADLLTDAAVVDLYAGSGALGLECVSRGAARADLVERSPKAAAVTSRNARAVGRSTPDAEIRVHAQSADRFLRGATGSWDLAFLDPPYDLTDEELTGTLTLLAPLLTEDATVIIERAARSPQPTLPTGLAHERHKRYGDTAVWWAVRS